MKTARRTAALVLLFAFCVLAFTISQNTGYAGTTTSVFGSTQTVHNTNIGVAGYLTMVPPALQTLRVEPTGSPIHQEPTPIRTMWA